MKTTLYHGCVVLPEGIRDGGVTVEDGRIARVFEGEDFPRDGVLVDCGGHYIAPGFVDIHTHACHGGDVMDGTVEAVHALTRTHGLHGTTSLMATTLSGPHEKIKAALLNVKAVMALPPKGAKVLGAHLEGNYFAPEMAGAQNPEYLYPPAKDDYMDFVSTGVVKRVAAAPELEGALDMGKRLSALGIQMSIGHSNGRYAQVMAAVEAGYTSLTHIYNAQSPVSSVFWYPDAGVCESALSRDEIRVECICDGNHLSPGLLKFIYKVKGAEGMIGVTDSAYAGAPDGPYKFGGLDVVVGNNICVLADNTAFAGSVATMDLCARTLYKKAGIPLVDVVKICSTTPAKTVYMENELGSLRKGLCADINVFDDEVNILYTMIDGKPFNNKL